MEQGGSKHDLRAARQEAVRGDSDIATLLATWRHTPKQEFNIEPATLKENPALDTPEERLSAIETALAKAVTHMHDAEANKVKPVVGMKTYSLAIMVETFGLTPEQIVHDHGALSDLTEYLTDMVRVTKDIDIRSCHQDPDWELDDDIQLVKGIRNTWELPDREFQFEGPYMYQRIEWVETDPAQGN
ncbi:hypothetical protein KW794_02150 [Candidatus Saccharibacteria bacterium]|nr:hypothetical protein [Candidatus Saccharibacteria bacterium]